MHGDRQNIFEKASSLYNNSLTDVHLFHQFDEMFKSYITYFHKHIICIFTKMLNSVFNLQAMYACISIII